MKTHLAIHSMADGQTYSACHRQNQKHVTNEATEVTCNSCKKWLNGGTN